MSDILIARELRARFRAVLAGMTVDPGAGPVAVALLDQLPAGFVLPEDRLPACYVFNGGEGLDYRSISEVERRLSLDVVLMARGSGDPMDQLDDMQLAVERAVIAAAGFGLARECRLRSVEPLREQGGLILAARVLKFEAVTGVTPDDPSL